MPDDADRLELQIMLEIVRVIGERRVGHPAGGLTLTEILQNIPPGVTVETIIGAIIEPKEIVLRDSYGVGQAANVGPGGVAYGNTFSQLWEEHSAEVDLSRLAEEIKLLRAAVRESASGDIAEDEVLGALASAEKAAVAGDGPGAMGHLQKAGLWVLDVAKGIGVPVAVRAIGAALGLPS